MFCLLEAAWLDSGSLYLRPPQRCSKVDPRVLCQHKALLRHLACRKSITKKLLKASKEKGCEIIACWIKRTRKRLYWCAFSTKSGFGTLIVAKWSSFLRHVANKHSDHPNPLYTNCNHGELEKRKWIKIGKKP